MPPGTFPGVDDTEVYEFLDRKGAQETAGAGRSSR
jgi:hypothetical protein